LPGFDQSQWQQRLESAVDAADDLAQTSSLPGWWHYNQGAIYRELDRVSEAEAEFREALLLPDGLLAYHLTRLALARH